jgi:hypothetical protein
MTPLTTVTKKEEDMEYCKPKFYSVIRLCYGKYKRVHQFCQFSPDCVKDFKIWCREHLADLQKKHEFGAVQPMVTYTDGTQKYLDHSFWAEPLKWAEAKRLIDDQFNEFNKMIFGACEDPSEFLSGDSWKKFDNGWRVIYTKFCAIEFDKDNQTVIVSHQSTESPNEGYIVIKHWIPMYKISALSSILMSAYFVRKARNMLEI